MNKLFVFGVLGLLLISGVSALSVDFFYSASCSHCKQVYPLVFDLSKQHKINFLDVTQGSYNIPGVPMIYIKTSDCRDIELRGSREIPRYLKCELNEMTTMECPTYSFNKEKQSWFIE